MDCKEVKEVLYDVLTHRLKDDELQKVNAHITQCEHCQKNIEELRGTLAVLDTWKTPELSPGFRASVLESIEERESRRPAAVIKRMLEWILQPPRLKRPLQGLAVVAMILLAFTVYRGLSPGPDRTMRDLPSPGQSHRGGKPNRRRGEGRGRSAGRIEEDNRGSSRQPCEKKAC